GDGGLATQARLVFPSDIAADAAGNLYIADSGVHLIRKVDPAGIITTIAGTGVAGETGDGGPAVNAQIESPGALALDSHRNLYFASNRIYIRKISTDGKISRVAGKEQ